MSETWSQLQYPAYAQPVPLDPADQVDRAGFPHWVQPPQQVDPVEYRYLLESFFFLEQSIIAPSAEPDFSWYSPEENPVLSPDRRHELGSFAFVNNPDLQVNPVFFEAWAQAIHQPVLAPEYRHLLPNFFGLGEPIPNEIDFGWYREADQPVLPTEYRHLLESFFDPANWEPIISTDSGVNFPAWLQPIEQPVLPVEYRYLLPSVFDQIDPNDFVVLAAYVATFTIRDTLQDLRSAILATGYVAECDIGQPKQITTDRVHAAIWLESTSVPEVSLSTTHDYFIVKVRFYTNAFADPQDMETMLAQAVSSSWVNWLADFDVGATVRTIDVAGIYGANLAAQWGHERVGDRTFRVADVTVPLIIDDIGSLTQ